MGRLNLLTRLAARQGSYEPASFIVWTSVFPIIPLLLLSWWLEGGAAMVSQLSIIGWRELGVIAYLALLSTLLGYGLWTRLLQRYAASTVAPLSLLVPVIGLLSAMLLLGEFPRGCNGWARWACCWAWWSTSSAAAGCGAEGEGFQRPRWSWRCCLRKV